MLVNTDEDGQHFSIINGNRILRWRWMPLADRCFELTEMPNLDNDLLDAFELYSKQNNVRHIYCEFIETYEHAKSFLTRRGYEPIAYLPDFYRPRIGKLIFRKELNG